jgi:hypothetical protein
MILKNMVEEIKWKIELPEGASEKTKIIKEKINGLQKKIIQDIKSKYLKMAEEEFELKVYNYVNKVLEKSLKFKDKKQIANYCSQGIEYFKQLLLDKNRESSLEDYLTIEQFEIWYAENQEA